MHLQQIHITLKDCLQFLFQTPLHPEALNEAFVSVDAFAL
jgi:hypothetical protein